MYSVVAYDRSSRRRWCPVDSISVEVIIEVANENISPPQSMTATNQMRSSCVTGLVSPNPTVVVVAKPQ